ncbi:MAG TPA: TIGR01777 family oxidoreductase [Phycisphaerae bacterium]|nr:TIGR01777 family oxidoreductase [Phycisphaerae bacterium]
MTKASCTTCSGERVLISGASGLIGDRVRAALKGDGHEVVALVRRPVAPGQREIHWDPDSHVVDGSALEGFDVVIHLAGENIAGGRWTPERKRAILRSRMDGTSLLSRSLAGVSHRPRVLISASAVGYYGHRDDEVVDEDSSPGKGFLAEVARQWEAATEPAREAGIRVVNLRIGMVLSVGGGALAKMLRPFRAGLGGVAGKGWQYVSWIALDDLVAVVRFVLAKDGLYGPINAVAPHPVTNREFVTTLGKVLHRPAVVPMPALAVRLMFGEMGQALLLEGARVIPKRLLDAGFTFGFGDLEAALRNELEKSASSDAH